MKNLLYISFLFSVQFAFAQSIIPEEFGNPKEINDIQTGIIYTQVYMPHSLREKVMFDSVLTVET